MIIKNYICDICKKSSVNKEDLIEFKIEVHFPGYGYSPMIDISKDICKKCLASKGLLVEDGTSAEKYKDALQKNNQTMENKLIDILQELDVSFTDHNHYDD